MVSVFLYPGDSSSPGKLQVIRECIIKYDSYYIYRIVQVQFTHPFFIRPSYDYSSCHVKNMELINKQDFYVNNRQLITFNYVTTIDAKFSSVNSVLVLYEAHSLECELGESANNLPGKTTDVTKQFLLSHINYALANKLCSQSFDKFEVIAKLMLAFKIPHTIHNYKHLHSLTIVSSGQTFKDNIKLLC